MKWIDFDKDRPKTYPPKYGKYTIQYEKPWNNSPEIHVTKMIWNGSGWAKHDINVLKYLTNEVV